ncbi:hypothetical protein [Urbifossiella limnaea]|uniref:Uncharacterized protein n=1 Tax=Urbifossiella limnaea TaxID=2528023 RepID=A0A517XRZ1_9BACT|nr:hypothetical protein [Urbifossiella limnaea]QDU20253.1 hypothetical protein ETAA1_21990 [Urbifossiella limnaea]
MLRWLWALVPAAALGCVTNGGSRVGFAPSDHTSPVREALDGVALKSIEKHLVGAGWVPFKSLHGSGGSSTEHSWHTHFACQKPGEFPVTRVWKLPEADYARILTPIRADVLAAVEKTGVEIGTATPVEMTVGDKTTARFEITYVRRGGEVAGVVEGMLGPQIRTSGVVDEFLDLVVRIREWYTR